MPLHFGDQIRVVEAITLAGQRCPLVLGVKDLRQSDTLEESSGTEEVAQHGVENDIAIAAACQHLRQRVVNLAGHHLLDDLAHAAERIGGQSREYGKLR